MSLQLIFVYITVALAIGYLAKKFVLPKRSLYYKKVSLHMVVGKTTVDATRPKRYSQ